jgi:hypothetical protein
LMSKTTSLESERDEAQRRESEMRKKARDAVRLTCPYHSYPFLSLFLVNILLSTNTNLLAVGQAQQNFGR